MMNLSDDKLRLQYVYRAREESGDFYDHRSFNALEPVIYFNEMQIRHHLVAHLKQRFQNYEGLSRVRVLEVGCAWGRNLNFFVEMGISANQIFGVDLLKHFIDRGKQVNPSLQLELGDATQLRFEANEFDIVMMNMVLSSVLDPTIQSRLISEVQRVAKPGGLIFVYDVLGNYPERFVVEGDNSKIVFLKPIESKILHSGFSSCSHLANYKLGFSPRVRNLIQRGVFQTFSRKWGGPIREHIRVSAFTWRRAVLELLSLIPGLRTHFMVVYSKPSQRTYS